MSNRNYSLYVGHISPHWFVEKLHKWMKIFSWGSMLLDRYEVFSHCQDAWIPNVSDLVELMAVVCLYHWSDGEWRLIKKAGKSGWGSGIKLLCWTELCFPLLPKVIDVVAIPADGGQFWKLIYETGKVYSEPTSWRATRSVFS